MAVMDTVVVNIPLISFPIDPEVFKLLLPWETYALTAALRLEAAQTLAEAAEQRILSVVE